MNEEQAPKDPLDAIVLRAVQKFSSDIAVVNHLVKEIQAVVVSLQNSVESLEEKEKQFHPFKARLNSLNVKHDNLSTVVDGIKNALHPEHGNDSYQLMYGSEVTMQEIKANLNRRYQMTEDQPTGMLFNLKQNAPALYKELW